jgi:sigma-B regulation protein RsbU (phosphoserine phosphatase)
MSDENAQLKKKVQFLEAELHSKNSELIIYRQELLKISQRLDSLMAQISSDTKVLSQVQKTLIPTEVPSIPGFEISRKFVYGSKHGGDYFDIFEHADKFKFGILVASSSGYAMSSLFMSLILKVSHVLEAKKGNPPDKILQQIADDIKKLAKDGDMTSTFYAVIDRRDFSLDFCSAGGIEGFYLTPQKPVQILKSTNSALSAHFNEKLSLAHLDLEPKSRLVVVTEGLTQVFTRDELIKILTDNAKNGVHDLRNELLFQAQRKSKTDEPLRDQTVVIIEVKEKVIKLAK